MNRNLIREPAKLLKTRADKCSRGRPKFSAEMVCTKSICIYMEKATDEVALVLDLKRVRERSLHSEWRSANVSAGLR